MDYQTFQPHPDLQSLVKCYWTLEVPADTDTEKQRIIPDGCIEMAFILGDDIKRYTSEDEFILQPRAMVLGQTIEPFYIEPTGFVNTFAIRFYPYGFANFTTIPLNELANKETPIEKLFGEKESEELEQSILAANDSEQRIKIIEKFLLQKLNNSMTIDTIIKTTVDSLFSTKGSISINSALQDNLSERRQLERKFKRQVGISPKQLGKIIRLQTSLKILIHQQADNLTQIAYESDYYDQSHFIKDFKEFTGITPKAFLKDNNMILSTLFYKDPEEG